jgi:glycine cleavage system regulatory protein
MKFFSLLAPLALVSSGLAFPVLTWNSFSQGEAVDIVNKFTQILAHSNIAAANATAQALIANNFVEKSDSINILAGIPVSSAL